MRENLGKHIYNLLKKPRFWIGMVMLLILSFIFDLTFATFVAAHGIITGKWSPQLLTVGFLYISINIGLRYIAIPYKKDIVKTNRLLIIFLFIWALLLYGFLKAFYFVAIIFLTARMLRLFIWFVKRSARFKKKY